MLPASSRLDRGPREVLLCCARVCASLTVAWQRLGKAYTTADVSVASSTSGRGVEHHPLAVTSPALDEASMAILPGGPDRDRDGIPDWREHRYYER
jgi:hypothetical protein